MWTLTWPLPRMNSVTCSLCLLASLASIAAAASTPSHSLEKRQTTVSKSS